jgi:ribonuclease R
MDNGMLHLDLPETELVLDKAGQVVDAHPADDSYPHTMIEMFMVEANDAVAALLDRLDVPFIRRIHPEPDALSMKNLAQLLKAFGITVPRHPDRTTVQDLLASVKGADCSFAVNIAVLRSFEKAQYAPLHIGHYALASPCYCHFTSPIRRYADLLIHRALQCYLENRIDSAKRTAAAMDLSGIGKHITFTEQRADDAEKELNTVLILQMLSKRIGSEIDGVVTGLTSFGVFVQCRKFGIEGLIRMGDLGPDQWTFNKRSQCIVGQRSGHTVRLGQCLQVRIVSVNVPARQLNVAPVEPLVQVERQRRPAPKRRRRDKGKVASKTARKKGRK